MAITAADLIQPRGNLTLALFPDLESSTLEDALEAYLTDAAGRVAAAGVASTDVDEATQAWAYYRAYTRIGERLLASERDARIEGQGSRRFEQEQADGFLAIAARWLAVYEGLVPAEARAIPAVPPSASVVNCYRW